MLKALLGMQWAFTDPTARTMHDGLPLRVITHNIRYATNSLFKNERPWSERRPMIMSQLGKANSCFPDTRTNIQTKVSRQKLSMGSIQLM